MQDGCSSGCYFQAILFFAFAITTFTKALCITTSISYTKVYIIQLCSQWQTYVQSVSHLYCQSTQNPWVWNTPYQSRYLPTFILIFPDIFIQLRIIAYNPWASEPIISHHFLTRSAWYFLIISRLSESNIYSYIIIEFLSLRLPH